MITLQRFQELSRTKPFVPFRLWMSDGDHVDVPTPQVVLACQQYAVIGLLDPKANDLIFDRCAYVWYSYVSRVEMLTPGTFVPESTS
jgi:hypothetical protein